MQEKQKLRGGYPVRLALLTWVSGLAVNATAQGVVEQQESAYVRDNPSRISMQQRDSSQPKMFGWTEKIILSPELRWKLDAKLDTGADTSSLDAIKIRRVRFKEKSYVRFSVRNPETGETTSLRRPYVRTVRIRQHSGDHQRRHVVLMEVCLGNAERMIEVTLTDREDFDYPVLLGRSALAGLAVVNSSATYTSQPDCQNKFLPESESVDENLPVTPDIAVPVSDSSVEASTSRIRKVLAYSIPGQQSKRFGFSVLRPSVTRRFKLRRGTVSAPESLLSFSNKPHLDQLKKLSSSSNSSSHVYT